MADSKITGLTALGAAPATNDLVPIVDVSDTTDSANGTTKKMTVANLMTAPTIADFTNANHDHGDADDGGQLTDAALSTAVGIAKGGTGQTTATAAFDALAPTTTQGDIIYHNGSDNIRLAKGTAGQSLVMNSTATAPEWTVPTNAFFQYIPFGTELPSTTVAVGSSQDGSTLFIYGGSTNELKRFARDANSGMYFFTHEVSVTTGYQADSIVVVGSYIYVFGDNGDNVICYRYLAANLTGEQLMTFATPIDLTGASYTVNTWTDGTFIYGVTDKTPTTSVKWSISGTTLTQDSTSTVTTGIFASNSGVGMCSFYDGTNAYIMDSTTVPMNVRKITTLNGTVYSSSTISLPRMGENSSDIDTSWIGILINIDSTRMYVGRVIVEDSAAAASVAKIFLMPVTKP